MEMKNKLFRHHKSKMSLVVRNFSLAFVGVFTILGGITIPTYFSISRSLNVVTQAAEENNDDTLLKNTDDPVEDDNTNTEEENKESNEN